MKLRRYIWLFVLMFWIIPQMQAQYLNRVCAGDEGIIYRIKGTEGSTFVWNVEGGSIVSNFGDSIILNWGDSIMVNWGDMSGEFTISVQEFSIHGCPANPVSGKVYITAPDIDIGNDIEICEGESVVIEPEGVYQSFLWHNGSTEPTFTAFSEGYISVIASDEFGCTRTDSIYLQVHSLPFVDLGSDSSLCGIEELQLDAGYDGIEFLWSTGESSQYITAYSGLQTIWVQVTDEYSCTSYDSINIELCSVEQRFKDMPTAFTPNGDGNNDEWRIPELEPYPLAIVEIFDRWGNLIFRSSPGYSNPWNGVSSDGRHMPMDSYYFMINLGSGETETVTGSVTIIK